MNTWALVFASLFVVCVMLVVYLPRERRDSRILLATCAAVDLVFYLHYAMGLA